MAVVVSDFVYQMEPIESAFYGANDNRYTFSDKENHRGFEWPI